MDNGDRFLSPCHPFNLVANHARLARIEDDIRDAQNRLNSYLRELGLETI